MEEIGFELSQLAQSLSPHNSVSVVKMRIAILWQNIVDILIYFWYAFIYRSFLYIEVYVGD
jgi:hypothetical protein